MDQAVFSADYVRIDEAAQNIFEHNQAQTARVKALFQDIKSMSGEEITEHSVAIGSRVIADIVLLKGFGLASCTALNNIAPRIDAFVEAAKAENIAGAAIGIKTPEIETFENFAVAGKVAADEGIDVADHVAKIIRTHPQLVQDGKTVGKAVQNVTKDVKVGRGSNFINQTKEQLLKSKASHEALVQEHELKLAKYISDPDEYDHLGLLKNISSEIRQRRIQDRINELERQIRRQRWDLDIINDLLKSKE